MQIQFLGTGASEGLPALFCDCRVCLEARKSGGRDIRRRSSVLINNDLLVDMTPDLSASCDACKCDLSNLPYMLITHDHYDHFYPSEFWNMVPPYIIEERKNRLELFGNAQVRERLETTLPPSRLSILPINFHIVKPFVPLSFGDYEVLPLMARHCPGALFYLIKHGGKSVLYAVDSGYFPEKTWDALADEKIDLVILDCNNPIHADTPNHMSIEDAVTVKRRLFQLGCTTKSVKHYVTHISHNGNLTHWELDERTRVHGFTIAVDGLKIEI